MESHTLQSQILKDDEESTKAESKIPKDDEESTKAESKIQKDDEQSTEAESKILKGDEQSTEAMDAPIYVTPEDITPEKKGGVTKAILKEGEGELPGYGDRVVIKYQANMIANGNVIPQGQEETTQWHLGRDDNVMKGLDLAVSTMKKGESATFFITDPQYHGRKGKYPPLVPPPPMYNIELVDVQLEDLSPKKDGSILRKVLKRGEGSLMPNEGSKVQVCLTGKYNGEWFENTIKDFILGEGCCHNIPLGVEIALSKFQKNEKSVIYLKNKYGLQDGIPELNIPSNSPVSYEVKMVAFQRVKEVWEMNSDEKLETAKDCRDRGNEFYLKCKYNVAWMYFKRIVLCLENEPGVELQTVEERKSLLLAGYLNMAACCLKLDKNKETIRLCDKALQLCPDNEKALFRRGMANLSNKDFEDALTDFKRLASLYPTNNSAKKHILECKEEIKKQELKAKSIYNNMFLKFKKQDEDRTKKMKTETGVWENEKGEGEMGEEDQHLMSETERLIQENDSVLRDANIIELSNNLLGKF